MSQNASSSELEQLLLDAIQSPYGKRVLAKDGDALRRKLYTIRQTRTEFKDLTFRISPANKDEVWIIKRTNQGLGSDQNEPA